MINPLVPQVKVRLWAGRVRELETWAKSQHLKKISSKERNEVG